MFLKKNNMVLYFASHVGMLNMYMIGQYAKKNGIHMLTNRHKIYSDWMGKLNIPRTAGNTIRRISEGYSSGEIRDVIIFGQPSNNSELERYSMSTARYLVANFNQEVRLIASHPYNKAVKISPPLQLDTVDAKNIANMFNSMFGNMMLYRPLTAPPPTELTDMHSDSIWVSTPGKWHYIHGDRGAFAAVVMVAMLIVASILTAGVLVGRFVKERGRSKIQ